MPGPLHPPLSLHGPGFLLPHQLCVVDCTVSGGQLQCCVVLWALGCSVGRRATATLLHVCCSQVCPEAARFCIHGALRRSLWLAPGEQGWLQARQCWVVFVCEVCGWWPAGAAMA